MNEICWKFFRLIFDVVCWASAISIISYWIYLFTLNADLSVVQYKSYCNDELHGFPILSLCFKNPFNSTKLRKINKQLNDSSYSDFLKGKYFSQEILQNDFNDIIFDISDYVVEDWVEWRNGSYKSYSHKKYSSFKINPTFAGFWRDEFYNCC